MTLPRTELDPQAAWEPWQPTAASPWNEPLAAHLYRRACFGAARDELRQAVRRSPQQCVDEILAASREENAKRQQFDDQMEAMGDGLVTGEVEALQPWWLYRMIFTPSPLTERMTLFWHGHFATSGAKVQSARMMLVQNRLFRTHALGRFEPLVQAVSKDPAMLIYLDSRTSARLHPNENYAREVMELFCLGEGHYTERDIQEVARCFTGWEVRQNNFRFNRHQHDAGTKTIFGQRGSFGGEDAVRIIVAQPAAPRLIARTLIAHFCCDAPVSDALIEPLARELRANEFEIAPTLRRIFTSRFFYSRECVGQKIRGPVELAVGLLRSLEGSAATTQLARALRPLGQQLFFPPNVKGWDGGSTWINATTVIGRVNFVAKLLKSGNARFAGGTLDEYFRDVASPQRSWTKWLAC